jgi:Ca2+-binding EF-hand superfamily protein
MVNGISSDMASAWAGNLFSKLDTQNKGYLDKAGLQSAFNTIDSDNSDVEDLFEHLDGDSDGKITETEMAGAFKNFLNQATGANDMGRSGRPEGPGGAPPPPQGEDTGFTKEELTGQLEEIGSSDDKRSSLISNIVNNFEAADSNEDGKVTAAEAMAYDSKNSTEASSSTASAYDSTGTSSENSDEKLAAQIMTLLHAYQVFQPGTKQTDSSSTLSVTA